MALSQIPKDRTVAALREVWASVDDLAGSLSDEQWAMATPLPAWDVKANVAHMAGTEAFLLGETPSATVDAGSLDHVRNPIGELNEGWVASFVDTPPAEVLERFRALTARRLDVLDSMSLEEWDAEGFTPAGKDAYGRFMQIRVFDCWMHEQDIRVALGQPGHDSGLAVEVTLDEMSTAMGYVVGKRAALPRDSRVTLELTGGSGRSIHVEVGERAQVVATLSGAPTTVLSMPVLTFSRLAGGRLDGRDHVDQVAITGDEQLGKRVLENLAYTI